MTQNYRKLLKTETRNYFKLKPKNLISQEMYKLKDEENVDLRDDLLINVQPISVMSSFELKEINL